MERRDFLRNSLLFTLGFRLREWPFRAYSFPSEIKLVKPVLTYTTFWSMIGIRNAEQYCIAWNGHWHRAGADVLPLPQLTDLQMQMLLAKSGPEKKAVSWDELVKLSKL